MKKIETIINNKCDEAMGDDMVTLFKLSEKSFGTKEALTIIVEQLRWNILKTINENKE